MLEKLSRTRDTEPQTQMRCLNRVNVQNSVGKCEKLWWFFFKRPTATLSLIIPGAPWFICWSLPGSGPLGCGPSDKLTVYRDNSPLFWNVPVFARWCSYWRKLYRWSEYFFHFKLLESSWTLPLSRSAAQRHDAPGTHLNANLLFKILPRALRGLVEFSRNHRCRERQPWPLLLPQLWRPPN